MTIDIDYNENATSDAKDMAQNFRKEIVDYILSGDEVSDDCNNDYANGDAYHHETHVDKEYDLQEAAELLFQLSDHEETDYGLWEGCEPVRAIACQAAYTYGNAVTHHWCKVIESINDSDAVEAIKTLSEDFLGDDLRSVAQRVVDSIIDDYS